MSSTTSIETVYSLKLGAQSFFVCMATNNSFPRERCLYIAKDSVSVTHSVAQ